MTLVTLFISLKKNLGSSLSLTTSHCKIAYLKSPWNAKCQTAKGPHICAEYPLHSVNFVIILVVSSC